MIRRALYRLFRWLASRCVDPRLAAAMPVAMAVLDEQLRRSVLTGEAGIAVRAAEAAIELAVGVDRAEPALVQQLSDRFSPLVFAFEAAKHFRNHPDETP